MPHCKNCGSTRPNAEIMQAIRTGARQSLCCVANIRDDAPPIAGAADPEYTPRLDAERVTLQFGQKSTRRLDSGRKPITEAPLFGGNAQGELF